MRLPHSIDAKPIVNRSGYHRGPLGAERLSWILKWGFPVEERVLFVRGARELLGSMSRRRMGCDKEGFGFVTAWI